MDFRVAPAGHGLTWFQQSIRMLDKNPRGLLAVALLLVLLEQAPNLLAAIPNLAVSISVLLMLLGPTLLAGMFYAIDEANAGRPVSPLHLFEGLRRRGARAQLLLLGVFVLLALLLAAVAAQRILGADNLAILVKVAAQKLASDSVEAQQMFGPLLKTMMVILVLLFVLLSGLFFAIPQVMFDGRSALPAFFQSIAACAANVLPLTVYGLLLFAACVGVGLALGILAALLGLLGTLGALLLGAAMVAVTVVVLLVSTSGNYLVWREVFGHASTSISPPHAGIVV